MTELTPKESRAPLLFRLAKHMIRHRVRGGHRLLETINRWGLMNRNVVCQLDRRVQIVVPMHIRDPYQLFDADFLIRYEEDLIAALAREAAAMPGPVTLIDCGADIGVFSVLMTARTPQLERIVAFEPNPTIAAVLDRNMERLPVTAAARHAAASDFVGRGALRSPPADSSVHARFLAPEPDGPIEVETIDSLGLGAVNRLILKIDVEGGEMSVIRGAISTLRRVQWFVVAFEAHPEVARRTGIDPMACVRLLQSVRPCFVYISEHPSQSLDSSRDYFDQYPTDRNCNLVCRSV